MLFRSALSVGRTATRCSRRSPFSTFGARLYSETPSPSSVPPTVGPKGGSQRWPLILSLGGIAGIVAWFSLDGRIRHNAVTNVNADNGDPALSMNEFHQLKLLSVTPYNHDSSVYVLELPDNKKSGLFVASAVLVGGANEAPKDDKGNQVLRPYTPINEPDARGKMVLLVKHYPNGKMTEHLKTLKPGDSLVVKGPLPKFEYKQNEFNEIGLIAGGSGITPIWQLLDRIAKNPEDKTKATVLYANKTEGDILLREELDALKKDPRFNIIYFVDDAPANWDGATGHINVDRVKELLPKPTDKVKIFVCGPPGQVKALAGPKKSITDQGPLTGALSEAGFTAEQVFKF